MTTRAPYCVLCWDPALGRYVEVGCVDTRRAADGLVRLLEGHGQEATWLAW